MIPSTTNTAAEITRLHSEIVESLQSNLEKALRIGELLTERKSALRHGQFTPWVDAHLPFTDRTARNYMRLYRERERLKTESVSDLGAAYKLLAVQREQTPDDFSLAGILAKAGCPPDPSFVPPAGRGFRFDRTDPNETLLIEPSDCDGFYYVTHFWWGESEHSGGQMHGTIRPVCGDIIALTLRGLGAESTVRLGDRNEVGCDPAPEFNRRLFVSQQAYLEFERRKWHDPSL